jgi:hypothetical protein
VIIELTDERNVKEIREKREEVTNVTKQQKNYVDNTVCCEKMEDKK